MMRRDFAGLVGGAAARPFSARMRRRDLLAGLLASTASRATRAAAAGKIYRVALAFPSSIALSEMSEIGNSPAWPPFFSELRRLGYVEGENLAIVRLSAEGDTSRYDSLIKDAVASSPDVIVTADNYLVLRFKALVQSIPIVAFMADPVALGVVTSIARPEGNITGVAADAGKEIWGKRLGMLIEAVPTATRVGFLCSDAVWDGALGAMVRDAARQSSITLIAPPLRGVYREPEYLRVFEQFQRERAEVLLASDSGDNFVQRNLIVELTEKARLPALYPYREFVTVGGLMAYAFDLQDMFRQGARYVDLILKGTRPGEIPIYQADKFTTIINLKTAKALGLTIPPTLLARADEVIE